jgi:hypothetical protein
MTSKILLVSSCTARKFVPAGSRRVSAESLYAGQQHVRLMRGVAAYRAAGQPAGDLRFRILSARHGLLPPRRAIRTYDQTFSGLTAAEIRRAAQASDLPDKMRALLRQPFEFGLLLLADPYLRACDLDGDIELGGPLLALCSPAAARRLPRMPGLRTVCLTNAEARRFKCGMVALKGELGRRVLDRLTADPSELVHLLDPATDVLAWIEARSLLRRPELVAA